MAKKRATPIVKSNKNKLDTKNLTEKLDKKLLSIKDVDPAVIDEFWELRDKYELDYGRKLNANEVLSLIISDAKNTGITLGADEKIVSLSEMETLDKNFLVQLDDIKKLCEKGDVENKELIKKLNDQETEYNTGAAEIAEKVKELVEQNAELKEKLENTDPDLQPGEFICKLSPRAIEVASQVKSYLLKKEIIKIPEGMEYAETLANYCIIRMLEYNYPNLVK